MTLVYRLKEIKKLSQWEYKIVEVSEYASAEEITSQLSELGKERWNCFHTSSRQTQKLIRLWCKRQPFTPLRFVPRGLF